MDKEVEVEVEKIDVSKQELTLLKNVSVNKKSNIFKDICTKILIPGGKKISSTILHSLVDYFVNKKPINPTTVSERLSGSEKSGNSNFRDRTRLLNPSADYTVTSGIRDRLYFALEEDAERCRERMLERTIQFGYVTIMDLKTFVGEKTYHTDDDIGWDNKTIEFKSDILETDYGFKLVLPPPRTIK